MIINTLGTLINQINTYFDDNSLVELSYPAHVLKLTNFKNKIIVFMFSINKEKEIEAQYNYVMQGQKYIQKHDPLMVNINTIFFAHFEESKAIEGLSKLNRVLSFFQSHYTFFVQKNEKPLILKILSPDVFETTNIWKSLQLPLYPNFICNISMLNILDEKDLGLVVPKIESTSFDINKL